MYPCPTRRTPRTLRRSPSRSSATRVQTFIVNPDLPLVGPAITLRSTEDEMVALVPTLDELAGVTTPLKPAVHCMVPSVQLYYPHREGDYFTVAIYDTTTVATEKNYVYTLLLNVHRTDLDSGYPLVAPQRPRAAPDNLFVVDVYGQRKHFSGTLPAPYADSDRTIGLSGFVRDNGLVLVSRAMLLGANPN